MIRMKFETLRRMLLAMVISAVALMGMSLPTNAHQEQQDQDKQKQKKEKQEKDHRMISLVDNKGQQCGSMFIKYGGYSNFTSFNFYEKKEQ